MGCFERLVKSHFLANVSAELQLARQTLQSMSQSSMDILLTYKEEDRVSIYNSFVMDNNIIEEIRESLNNTDDAEDINYIYYAQVEYYIFAYSKSLKQLNEAIRYSRNLNGDIPLYITDHIVDDVRVYTALIDTRLQFDPISPN